MLKYYLIYYWRSLKNNKVLSFINILGLAAGLAGSIILFLWVYNETGQDKFHQQAEDIYLITTRDNDTKDFREYSPFAKPRTELFESVAGISAYSHINTLDNNVMLRYNQQKLRAAGLAVSPAFFDIFTFPLIRVDSVHLEGTNYVFLTEKMAAQMFNQQDPVGKMVIIQHEMEDELVVAGLLKNPPPNSSLQFDFIANYEAARWSRMGQDFIKLVAEADPELIREQVKDFGAQSTYANANFGEIELFPYTDLYFNSEFDSFPRGDIKYVYILSAVALIVLVIAFFNFFNLSISQSLTRMKSIGIKRLMGMSDSDLTWQFTLEALLNFALAAGLVLILLIPLQALLQKVSGKQMAVLFWDFDQFKWHWLGLFAIFSLLGFLTFLFFKVGSPLMLLKKQVMDHQKTIGLKSKLVVFQFLIASVVVVAALVITRQTEFMVNQDPGYQKENIVKIQFNQAARRVDREQKRKNHQYVLDQLEQKAAILAYDYGNFPTETTLFYWNLNPEKFEEGENVFMYAASSDFHQVFDIEILAGKSFLESDEKGVFINEAAVDHYQIEDPVGQTVVAQPWGDFTILGVVKDFHFENMSQPIKPLVIVSFPYSHRPLVVRIASGQLSETMTFLRELFQEVNPGVNFEYEFFDDHVEATYRRDIVTTQILKWATIFIFLLSGVGLFSLSVVFTMQKTKEIGIRKVLGASTAGIWMFLSRSMTKWVGIGFLVAVPLSYYLIIQWLNNFAYRIGLEWWYFALAGGITFVLALMVVSYQSLKAAWSNPVDALRYE